MPPGSGVPCCFDPLPQARIAVGEYDDVALTDGNDVADVVGDCYRRDGAGETIVVTRSNSSGARV